MTTYADRKQLLSKISKARNSVAISYVTSDRRGLETQISADVVDIFVEHLDAIGPTKKLSLVLHTNGGDTSAAWRLVNLLHTFCDELEIIVTTKALSAGTLISLGADTIVMTKQAALGPIDPSINSPLNPVIPNSPGARAPVSVEAVRGYLDAAKEMGATNSADAAAVLIDLSNKVHPLVLGQIFRSRSQIRFLAKKLLSRHFGDGREEQANRLIDFLCAESGSHDYTINRREAKSLGLSIEKPSEKLYGLLRRLHLSYVTELALLEPFDPFTLLGNQPTVNYTIPRAMIESTKAGGHHFVSEGTLVKMQVHVPGPMGPIIQDDVSDNRRFEGWRKTA